MDHRIKKANRKKKKKNFPVWVLMLPVMNWRWIMYISVTGGKI